MTTPAWTAVQMSQHAHSLTLIGTVDCLELDLFIIQHMLYENGSLSLKAPNRRDNVVLTNSDEVFQWLHQLAVQHRPWTFTAMTRSDNSWEINWVEPENWRDKYSFKNYAAWREEIDRCG